MSHKSAQSAVSTIGIDLGKNSFHLVGLDQRGAIVWQLKCSRAQLERRLANIPSCLIGMEACSGAHYIARQLAALGHDMSFGMLGRLHTLEFAKPRSPAATSCRPQWQRIAGIVLSPGRARSRAGGPSAKTTTQRRASSFASTNGAI